MSILQRSRSPGTAVGQLPGQRTHLPASPRAGSGHGPGGRADLVRAAWGGLGDDVLGLARGCGRTSPRGRSMLTSFRTEPLGLGVAELVLVCSSICWVGSAPRRTIAASPSRTSSQKSSSSFSWSSFRSWRTRSRSWSGAGRCNLLGGRRPPPRCRSCSAKVRTQLRATTCFHLYCDSPAAEICCLFRPSSTTLACTGSFDDVQAPHEVRRCLPASGSDWRGPGRAGGALTSAMAVAIGLSGPPGSDLQARGPGMLSPGACGRALPVRRPRGSRWSGPAAEGDRGSGLSGRAA